MRIGSGQEPPSLDLRRVFKRFETIDEASHDGPQECSSLGNCVPKAKAPPRGLVWLPAVIDFERLCAICVSCSGMIDEHLTV